MSRFLSDFGDGIRAYSKAWRLVKQLNLWIYLVLPGLLSLLIGILIILGAIRVGNSFSDFIGGIFPWQNAAYIVSTLAGILSAILLIALGLMLYKYLVLIIVSPFMSPLSEKVEMYLLGKKDGKVRFTLGGMLNDLVRGLRINVRNIIRELFYTLILVFIGFIPLIGLVSSALILLIQTYYAGFGNIDFTLERHFGVRGSVAFVRGYRGMAIGNGTIFLLLLAIPLLGLMLAPGLGAIAATIETVKRLDDDHQI